MKSSPIRIFSSVAGVLALSSLAVAGPVSVSLDTSLLVGNGAAPFSIGFELVDGSGIGDGNNAVVVTNFQFGSGGPTGSPFTAGASGDLSSTVLLTDLTPASVFAQTFAPGNTLSFDLDFTNNVDPGAPDEFFFVILDSTLTPIPTTGFLGFLEIDFDSAIPTIQTFAADANQSLGTGAPGIPVPAPDLTDLASTPEPSTFAMGALSLALLLGLKIRRR